MFAYDATDVLSQIKVPTLIIGADQDKLTKLEASVRMNQDIAGSKLLILKPAGHMGFIERHQQVNEAVSRFLLSAPVAAGDGPH